MKTAFEILSVSDQADDQTIKTAYLHKVKQYPPEQAPDQFQAIKDAYEMIKNAQSRAAYQLFYRPEVDFDALLEKAFETEPVKQLDGAALFELIRPKAGKK